MRRVYENITECVGDTPLVRLGALAEGVEGNVYAKIEYMNPGCSVKDRIALQIIEDAEASGELKPGGTIVEATSGNTGAGLAMAISARTWTRATPIRAGLQIWCMRFTYMCFTYLH